MNMAVKHVARLKALEEPAKDLEACVAAVRLVLHATGRRVCHQDIQVATPQGAIQEKLRQHLRDPPTHLLIAVLERSLVVPH